MGDDRLRLSEHVSYHEHHGSFYVYQNEFGYLLKMGHDVLLFLDSFAGGLACSEAHRRFDDLFGPSAVDDFVTIFRRHLCLLGAEDEPERRIWEMHPVRARWIVAHVPADEKSALRLARLGPEPEPSLTSLRGWRRRLWELIDGERTCSDLFVTLAADTGLAEEEVPPQAFLKTLRLLTDARHQALRLSEHPLSYYEEQPDRRPPYLTSVLPYARFEMGAPAPPPLEEQREVSPSRYFAERMGDARAHFDEAGATLSHLFREPHEALGGESYGARMASALHEHGVLPRRLRDVVEVGGGLGGFARSFAQGLGALRADCREALHYHILDVSPPLREAQRQLLENSPFPISFLAGDAERLELPPESVDLLLCNETAGDFTAVRMSRGELDLDLGADDFGLGGGPSGLYDGIEQRILLLGEVGEMILRYDLPLQDAPGEFYVNLGLFRFLERTWLALRPGGTAVITEFGDEHEYAQLSAHLDHPEFSIHFGHAKHVARRLGFDVEYSRVLDLLAFDRKLPVLASTHAHFSALRALLQEFGVPLRKIAYTERMLRDAMRHRLSFDEVEELPFEALEHRCMGLVPDQFKVLVLRKPE